jgi:signal transduction histidine kinase
MCQIVDEAKNIMKMFQGEFAAKDIKSRLIVEEDFEDLGISWVLLDPSRLAQIVINMLTNAIKFTAERPTRMINIRLTASLEEPETIRGVEFLPRKKGMEDLTLRPEWGEGKAIFLGFLVEDT